MTALNVFLILCRVWVVWYAVFIALFGQLFVGAFAPGASWTALAGLIVVSFGPKLTRSGRTGAWTVVGLCATAILGVGADAQIYYTRYAVPGNDFAGSLQLLLFLPILFLSIPAIQRLSRRTS